MKRCRRTAFCCISSNTFFCVSVSGPALLPNRKSVYPVITASGVFSWCAAAASTSVL